MSMGSNVGESAAAEEVMAFITSLWLLHNMFPDTEEYQILMLVYRKAEAIKKSADDGWY